MKKSFVKTTYFEGFMVIAVATLVTLALIKGCGTKEAKIIQSKSGGNGSGGAAITCADGSEVGKTRRQSCPVGQEGVVLEACNAQGSWVQADSSCRAVGGGNGGGGGGVQNCSNLTTFKANVLPVLQENCLSCHPTYDYEEFSAKIDEATRRVTPDFSGRKMPPPTSGRSPLEASDIEIFVDWKADGLLEECDGGSGSGGGTVEPGVETVTLQYIEERIEADLNRLRSNDRVNSRYISFASKLNEGVSEQTLENYKKGLEKNLSSLTRNGSMYELEQIDARGALWRIDLDELGLDASPRFGQKVLNGQLQNRNFWDLLLDFERFNFFTQTRSGLRIAELAETPFAWADIENFNFISRYDDEVYYAALDMPGTQQELFRLLNFDFEDEVEDFNCNFMGGSESPISVNKNRLIVRCELDQSPLSMDGSYIYLTFDSLALDGIAERNLQQFPLLAETGSDLVFDFAASEIIWRLPNGLQAYWLNAANGLRQAEAPINIVTDVEVAARGLGTEIAIQNAGSCDFCHSSGILPFVDQIREFAESGGSDFNANDLALIKAYYKPQNINQNLFQKDRLDYAQTLRQLNIDANATDPINGATDNLRRNWGLKKVCGYFLLELEECRNLIDNRVAINAQIGALLNRDGQVSFLQVLQTAPDILAESRFGLDDVNE